MSQHMNVHRGKYMCMECGKCCLSGQHLAQHQRTHSGEKPFECTLCSKRFTTSELLVTHSRTHSGEKPYKCHVCDKAFSQRGNLRKHQNVHTGERPYECFVCNKTFSETPKLKLHMRVHTGEKLHNCCMCDKAFSQSSDLKVHMRIHTGEKPYKCHVCEKTFNQSGDLRSHTRVHTGEKPYDCSLCNKSFSRSNTLLKHQRRVHSNATDGTEADWDCLNVLFFRVGSIHGKLDLTPKETQHWHLLLVLLEQCQSTRTTDHHWVDRQWYRCGTASVPGSALTLTAMDSRGLIWLPSRQGAIQLSNPDSNSPASDSFGKLNDLLA